MPRSYWTERRNSEVDAYKIVGRTFKAVFSFRGASPLGLPYTVTRGAPPPRSIPVARFAVLARGSAPRVAALGVPPSVSRYPLRMAKTTIDITDLAGVFAVPPLPRHTGARRTLDFDAAEAVAKHIENGGITRYLYGGNAFLYHITLDEYETLLGWLDGFDSSRWPIPSVGPSFGRAIDQAKLVRRYSFRTVMVLPCNDPRDARGMEAGLREIADACGVPLILYLKSEDGFGSDKEAGLDAVGRLVRDGVAVAIKYAVVLEDPRQDPYLDGLLRRVDRQRVISGMGERPAIVHMRDFTLPGFTTGSGCIAARACSNLFDACVQKEWTRAEEIRAQFMALEDLRDAWGPARVLHHATELAGIATTGSIPPYVSGLGDKQLQELAPVARALRDVDARELVSKPIAGDRERGAPLAPQRANDARRGPRTSRAAGRLP